MRRVLCAAALLACVAGCEDRAAILKPGTEVVFDDPEINQSIFMKWHSGPGDIIREGDVMRVMMDPCPDSKPADRDTPYRWIRVRVLEGQAKGSEGSITRSLVRPLR